MEDSVKELTVMSGCWPEDETSSKGDANAFILLDRRITTFEFKHRPTGSFPLCTHRRFHPWDQAPSQTPGKPPTLRSLHERDVSTPGRCAGIVQSLEVDQNA